MLKKLRFLFLYTLYLITALAAIDYFFFYRPYLRELRANKDTFEGYGDLERRPLIEIPHVPPAVMRRLGRMSIEKKSAFAHFDPEKPAGVVRICAYGDSFTFGDETGPEHDYPSLLRKRFERAGARNVEVLNFGVAGFGFHQTYMLWESVGRRYGCDFTLLGPQGFQPIRDTTFGYIHHWSPYYLHARYVLDGDDVRLVEIPGETYGERFDQHFGFFPRWHVLRYDRNPPMFLRALIPRNRELKNPFYYDSRSMEEEAHASYKILLGKMAASGERILVGHYDPDVVDLAREVGSPALRSADLYQHHGFPYLAPVGHDSPWGNHLLAEQFFRWLTGQDARPLDVLESFDLDQRPARAWAPGAPAFSSYTRIAVELAGVAVGSPAINSADWRPTRDAFPTDRSALAFQDTTKSLVEACFLAFDGELRPDMAVTVRTAAGGEQRLGVVDLLDARVSLGIVEIEGMQYDGLSRLFFSGNPRISPQQLAAGPITVLVDGQEVLQGSPGTRGALAGSWLSSARPCWVFRGTLAGLVEPETLPDTGSYDLVLERAGDVLRLPLALWRQAEPDELPEPPPAPRERIAIDVDGNARIVPGG